MMELVGGRVRIPPVVPVEMGCGDDRTPTAAVRDELEANAILLRADGAAVLFVSLDCLYVGPQLRAGLEAQLAGRLEPERIFLAASHTHYAPMLDPTKPELGHADPAQVEWVAGEVANLCRDLLDAEGVPVTVESAEYQTRAAMGRRRRRLVAGVEGTIEWNSVVIAPAKGPREPQRGHVVLLRNRAGEPVAAMWQLPCHPTSLPVGDGHCAHYPGVGRRALRKQLGADIPMVFLQGFSGDLRPPAVASPAGLAGWGRRIVLGPWFGPFGEDEYSAWCKGVTDEMLAAATGSASQTGPDDPVVDVARVEVPLSDIAVENEASGRVVSFHRVSIGGLDFVGVSAEPVAAYASWLALQRSDRITIPVGCIDDVFGYAPTDVMVREGGYESQGFLRHFGLQALRPGVEGRVKELLLSVLPGQRTQSDSAVRDAAGG